MPFFSHLDPAIKNKKEIIYRSVPPSYTNVVHINCDHLFHHQLQLHCISYYIPNFIDVDNLLNQAIPQINQFTGLDRGLDITIAAKIKALPAINLSKFSVPRELISPKTNKEQITAKGTTALLKAAMIPGFVWLAPLFQRKKPSPEAINPR